MINLLNLYKDNHNLHNKINLDNPNPNYLIFIMLFYINKLKSNYKLVNLINLDKTNPNNLI